MDEMLAACGVLGVIDRERKWLQLAFRCYNPKVYQRLANHAALRIQYVLANTYGMGTVGIKLQVLLEQRPVGVLVELDWQGRRAKAVFAAVHKIQAPTVRA